jgi:8-oxo-dGTP pyrophosphatase MutT (NUDIX family)
VTFQAAVGQLEASLGGPLPGTAAHALLMPRPRRAGDPQQAAAPIRHAAGLLLVFPVADRAHVVLTRRAHGLGRHSGQVSLPGGVKEAGETLSEAALREAHEEIGLAPDEVRLLGELTPLDIPVSGFRLHPIVAALERRPRLTAAASEVAGILEVSIEALLDPSRLTTTTRVREGRRVTVPAFHVCGAEIWGATAMVLAEFLTLLGWKGLRN